MKRDNQYYTALLRGALTQAWKALPAFRLRSFFVILAVSLGIASLTIIVASLEGANNKIDELVGIFGPDAAFVTGGSTISRAVGQRTRTITWDDVRIMRDSLPGVYIVAPMSFTGKVTLVYANRNFELDRVMGSTENYGEIWNWPLAEGRDISAGDMARGSSVCLIGGQVSQELFGNGNPIGKTIMVARVPFTIIGRLSDRGISGGGGNLDETLVMPLSTMIQRFHQDRQYFRMVRLKFTDPQNMDLHAAGMRSLLRYLHGLGPSVADGGEPDDFTIITALDVQRFISMIKGGLSIFLGLTAMAAICVSGFVLANLFYISVSERSMEVGLKKALGAPSLAITMQFLCESVLLTLGGALLGLVWGGLLSLFLRNSLFSIELSWRVFFCGALAAVLIGLVFGLRPARRAAALEPISALKGGG